MSGKRRKYTQEFKDSAVKLVTEQGYKISEAARNLDINVSLIRRWKAESEAVQQEDDSTVDLRRVSSIEEREPTLEDGARDIKKGNGFLRKRIRDRYQLIDTEKDAYPISLMCEVLEVPRRGYYAWKQQRSSARQQPLWLWQM